MYAHKSCCPFGWVGVIFKGREGIALQRPCIFNIDLQSRSCRRITVAFRLPFTSPSFMDIEKAMTSRQRGCTKVACRHCGTAPSPRAIQCESLSRLANPP